MTLLALPALATADSPPESAAMIEQVNAMRSSNGLPQLQSSDELTGSARSYARYMLKNDYLGHLSSIRAGGRFPWLGETLAWHFDWRPRVNSTLSRWMASPPHRAVLMNPTYRFIGTGRVKGRYGSRVASAWVAQLGG